MNIDLTYLAMAALDEIEKEVTEDGRRNAGIALVDSDKRLADGAETQGCHGSANNAVIQDRAFQAVSN